MPDCMCRTSSETSRAPSAAVVHGGVDHVLVDPLPQNAGRAVHQRLDEQRRVEFVDVILVDHGLVEPAETVGDLLRQVRLADSRADTPGRTRSTATDTEIPMSKSVLCCDSRSSPRRLRGTPRSRTPVQECSKWLSEIPNPVRRRTKATPDHQRNQHHHRTLMRLAMAVAHRLHVLSVLCP